MIGAIVGDIVGSVYEWHNINHKPDAMHGSRRKFR